MYSVWGFGCLRAFVGVCGVNNTEMLPEPLTPSPYMYCIPPTHPRYEYSYSVSARVTGQLQDPVHFYVFCVENRRVDHLNYFSYVEIYEGKSDTHGRVNA